MMISPLKQIMIILLIVDGLCAISNDPIWVSSSLIKAGSIIE